MKIILSLLVLLFPFKGFSPQEGGGGNVCYYQNHLVLLDEFYVDYGSVLRTDTPPVPVKPVFREDPNGEQVMDFTRMDPARVFLMTLNWYEKKLDRDLFRELRDYFMALDTIYIKNEHFTEAWGPDGHDRIGCARGFMRAMIVSTPEGVTILSTKDWDELHPQRKQIAMFHETLRLSQLHSSWFKGVMNDELSELTMMLYHGAMRDVTSHKAYKIVKEKLKRELYTPVTIRKLKEALAEKRSALETHLEKGELKSAVQRVSEIAVLLKRRDIKLGREPEMHFASEMKKLRSHPLYSEKVPGLVRHLRNL